jgi:hypothetical protein
LSEQKQTTNLLKRWPHASHFLAALRST